MKKPIWSLGMLAIALAGCAEEPDLGSGADDLGTFEEFRARTYREPGPDGRYIVEGDIGLEDDAALEAYWAAQQPGQLTVATSGSTDKKWNSTQKLALTWCVDNSFGTNKTFVVNAMESASREWEQRANVDFTHVAAQDGSGCTNSNNNVLFNVKQVSVGGQYAAAAFLPGASRSARQLNVNAPTLNNTPAGMTGVLGHELGHILGFQHEHLRDPACNNEPGETWRDLTTYDQLSIMNHLSVCGSRPFSWWSEKDRVGSAALYGAGARSKSDILWRRVDGYFEVWLMAGGSAAMGAPILPSVPVTYVGTGDFDGDGRNDVLWRDSSDNLSISFMNGTVELSRWPISAATVAGWVVLGVGDFNGDDRADILWRQTSDNSTSIWFMNGVIVTSTFWPGASSRALDGIGDFDGDGVSDILWAPGSAKGVETPRVMWLMSDGTIKQNATLQAGPAGYKTQGIGDLNGDNFDDIVLRDATGNLKIRFMQGVVTVAEGAVAGLPNDWKLRGVGDFDGDWNSDLLWRNDNGTNAIWFMNGTTHNDVWLPTVDLSWSIVGAGNFD